MISCDGNKISVLGTVTIENVLSLTQRGIHFLGNQTMVIDLARVTEVDSTIISMMLEWLRAAHCNGQTLQFINTPENLDSLIQLYGVAELLPVCRPDNSTDA